LTEISPTFQYKYALALNQVFDILNEVTEHDDFEESEDLGDFIDAVKTIVSFAPTVSPDISWAARQAHMESRGGTAC